MPNKASDTSKQSRDLNQDPITGEPGSHPVGTGVGAAAGGATGAAIGSMGGPIGTAVGAVVGAVAGGLAGKGVAEAIDPTAEDAYWREHHRDQPFARDREYDDYAPAYRTGYTGYREGETFDDRESDLRSYYETSRGTDLPEDREAMRWDEAREAARAAYDRVKRGEAVRTQPRVSGTNDI